MHNQQIKGTSSMKNPVQLTRELPEHSARFALSTGENRLA